MEKMRPSRIAKHVWLALKDQVSEPKFDVPDPDDPFYTCPNDDDGDHNVDLDEEGGYWYCIDCSYFSDEPRHNFSLDELWRLHHLWEEAEYIEGKPRPIRKNQKITNGELEDYFESIEGKYLKVSVLKKMFGPTPDNPAGLIRVNDVDTSTTVISSSYLRRLKRITGRLWRQERALGEKDEMLVRFTGLPSKGIIEKEVED